MPPIDVIIGLMVVCVFGFFLGMYSTMGYYVKHDDYPVKQLSNGKILSNGLLYMYIFGCAFVVLSGFLLIYGLGNTTGNMML